MQKQLLKCPPRWPWLPYHWHVAVLMNTNPHGGAFCWLHSVALCLMYACCASVSVFYGYLL